MDIKRVIIPVKTHDYNDSLSALKMGIQTAISTKKPLYLVTCTRQSEVLEKILGKSLLSQVKKGGILNNVETHLETISTFKYAKEGSIIVCFHLPVETLEKIDDIIGVKFLIVVEWQPNEYKNWAKRWGVAYDNTEDNGDETISLPQAILNGLKILSNSINLSSGLEYPTDAEKCKTTARVIFKYVPNVNVEEIKSILISQFHWRAEYAEGFSTLIRKLQNKKTFQGGERSGLKTIYERWNNYKD